MRLLDSISKAFGLCNRFRKEKNERLVAENDKFCAFLADSTYKCVYCGLSKNDMARCASNFLGCARADDLVHGISIGVLELPEFDASGKDWT
jgi:hypothetical protein